MTTVQEVWTQVAHVVQRTLEDRFSLPRRGPVDVQWNLRGVSSLGQSVHGGDLPPRLRLSPAYAVALGDDYLDVVVHEVCHHITNRRYAVAHPKARNLMQDRSGAWRPHGARWSEAMRVQGLDPRRLREVTPDQLAMVKGFR